MFQSVGVKGSICSIWYFLWYKESVTDFKLLGRDFLSGLLQGGMTLPRSSTLIYSCSLTQVCPTLCDTINCSMSVWASMSFAISRNLLKLMSVESVMPSSVAPFFSCPQSFQASGSFPVGLNISWRFPQTSKFLCHLKVQGKWDVKVQEIEDLIPRIKWCSLNTRYQNVCNFLDFHISIPLHFQVTQKFISLRESQRCIFPGRCYLQNLRLYCCLIQEGFRIISGISS